MYWPVFTSLQVEQFTVFTVLVLALCLHLVLMEDLGEGDKSFKPLCGILLTTEKMSQHV